MDEIEMAPDDFRKRILGMLPGVAREQFQIGVVHVQKDNVAAAENPPGNFQFETIANGRRLAGGIEQ